MVPPSKDPGFAGAPLPAPAFDDSIRLHNTKKYGPRRLRVSNGNDSMWARPTLKVVPIGIRSCVNF
jgi:hypothetical protein